MSIEYDQYLREHIAAVNDALRWMADNVRVPYITETDFNDAIWNATDHDKSKYDKEEYDAYDEYFYGGNRSYQVVEDFNYAWLHHQNTNKHHWQYWVLIHDDPMESEEALAMPIPYILEMIADWWSFSWRKGNLFEIFDWYIENENSIILNPDTRHVVEDILNAIRTVLEMQERVKGRGEDFDDYEYCDLKHGELTDEEVEKRKYAFPEERKFPMPDAKHVRSAIRFFNYVDPDKEEKLAKAILERMDEYGMSFDDFEVGDENRFKKYIPKKEQKE